MQNHMMIWVKHFMRVDHSTIYPPTSCQENTISNFHHSMPVSSIPWKAQHPWMSSRTNTINVDIECQNLHRIHLLVIVVYSTNRMNQIANNSLAKVAACRVHYKTPKRNNFVLKCIQNLYRRQGKELVAIDASHNHNIPIVYNHSRAATANH